MHLAEGMLPSMQAAGWTVAATTALIWSIRGEQRIQQENASSSLVMAGATSLLFAATLLPLPVPVVGATSHICLTPVLALIVGVRRIVWPTFFVLFIQAIFFAHGGLTTLGVNTLTLGLVGPVITFCIWMLLRKIGLANVIGLGIACGFGGLSVYVINALVLSAALADVAEPTKTFIAVLIGFSPVQIPLAVLESIVSVGIIRVLATRRPDLLPDSLRILIAGKVSISSISSTMIVLMMVGLAGCNYEGIDGSVFGAASESAGRPPTNTIVDLSQGEFGLAMAIIILFGMGFIGGRSWERLTRRKNDALPR